MSGRAPKDKGNRLERLAVTILKSFNLDAYRVPLSGAARGFNSDCVVRLAQAELRLECKSRRNGFSIEYKALTEGNQACIIKADRQEPLICMPLRAFASLLARAEGVKLPEPNSLPSPLLNQQSFYEEVGEITDKQREFLGQDRPGSVSENLTGEDGGLEPSPLPVSRET